MATTKYSKWIPSPLDGLSLEELLDQMSEFFLQSGFQYGFHDVTNPRDLESLRQAIMEKLVEVIDQLIRQMIEEGWIQSQQYPAPSSLDQNAQGTEDENSGGARFEL